MKAALAQSDRKIRYYTYDLKAERIIVDAKNERITFVPSREDSYDRLTELGNDYSDGTSIEDMVVKKLLIENMKNCIELLPPADRKIILAHFFDNTSQTELALLLDLTQQAISYRVTKAVEKLKKLMKI